MDELENISAAAGSDAGYWIDAEGKLRDTEDRFDMRVARQFLEIATAFETADVLEITN